ncbi:NAD(P)H-dependent oxidoreductase [Chitinophagaceae bacterium LWZ2-11]
MKTAIIFNHPYSGSYCNAILESVIRGLQKAGHTIDVLHLDNEGFNPVMTAADLKGFVESKAVDPKVLEYQQRLQDAGHLIFIFPIWWELMPAMTKGFIDKVIYPGIAYNNDRSGRIPRMVKAFEKVKGVTVITTMNTPSIMYRLLFGNAIKKALFTGTLWKTGYKNRKWISFNMVKFVSDKKRKKWLIGLEQKFARL